MMMGIEDTSVHFSLVPQFYDIPLVLLKPSLVVLPSFAFTDLQKYRSSNLNKRFFCVYFCIHFFFSNSSGFPLQWVKFPWPPCLNDRTFRLTNPCCEVNLKHFTEVVNDQTNDFKLSCRPRLAWVAVIPFLRAQEAPFFYVMICQM